MKLGTEQLAAAEEYAAYLQSPAGRIRTDLSWANLCKFLLPSASEPCALDLGGGTGAISVRLARLGFHVTLVDISDAMLAVAERASRELKLKDRILLQQADATQLLSVCREHSQDLIVCHNLLEYLDDVPSVLDHILRVLKPSGTACVSIVVRNRMGEVMKAAIKDGNCALAEENLTAARTREPLGGEYISLFSPSELRRALSKAGLKAVAEWGIRVFADYLPAHLLGDEAAYARVLALELKLGAQPEFAGIARYTQVLARVAEPQPTCSEKEAKDADA